MDQDGGDEKSAKLTCSPPPSVCASPLYVANDAGERGVDVRSLNVAAASGSDSGIGTLPNKFLAGFEFTDEGELAPELPPLVPCQRIPFI